MDCAELQYMPYAKLVAAGVKVLERQSGPGLPETFAILPIRWGGAPVMDGRIVSQHPFDPSAPAISANVPMIVGTTLNEFVNNINNPDGERMTSQTLLERTKMIYGDRAKQVLAAFRERTPSATPFAIWSRISCAPIRSIAIEQCIRKAEQGASPVYLYWFTWPNANPGRSAWSISLFGAAVCLQQP